jgi:hypothetical protein
MNLRLFIHQLVNDGSSSINFTDDRTIEQFSDWETQTVKASSQSEVEMYVRKFLSHSSFLHGEYDGFKLFLKRNIS